MTAFEELGVMPEIISALDEMDWLLPTPVQTEAIPLILGGGDVAVAAETGSGKTGAFCIPIVQIVYETRRTNLTTPLLTSSINTDSKNDAQTPALSTVDRGRSVAVDNVNNIAQCRHPVIWDGVRATRGVSSGKWYFIVKMCDEGISRVGWSSRHASLILGTDRRGFGYGGTAMKSHKGKFDPYGEKYTKSDVICCMIQFSVGETLYSSKVILTFLKNEQVLGEAFSVSFAELGKSDLCMLPAVAMKNAEVQVDFLSSSEYAESRGFKRFGLVSDVDSKLSQDVEQLFDAGMKDSHDGTVTGDRAGNQEKTPLALILEPSRELAGQVHDEVQKAGKYLPQDVLRVLLLMGGGNPKQERAFLQRGCDIVAGTLGSVVANVKKGTLSLDNIRFFVLDEADTFATDNLPDVAFLHKKIPVRNRVQTLLFSATLHSPEIKALSTKIQSFPTWVDLKGKDSVPDTLHHTMIMLDANTDAALLDTVPASLSWPLDHVHEKKKKPGSGTQDNEEMEDAADVRSQTTKKLKLAALRKVIDAHNMSQAMIFVRTQLDGDNVESFLIQCSGVAIDDVPSRRFRGSSGVGPELEYSCAVLHGGRRQQERNDALATFKAGEVRFLICTDVAARGIDVVGLPYLINVTLPDQPENYIHRVGRVGRAERLGLAVSLVAAQKEAVWFHKCGKSKGGVCNRRSLVSAGGCVMWLNESKMLAEIENRLKGRVEELGSDFRRKNQDAGVQAYGARVGENKLFEETARHVEQLKPALRELIRLEEDVQASFFAVQSAFSIN